MKNTDYTWDERNKAYSSKMGQYKTKMEFCFIENILKIFPFVSKVLDVGGGRKVFKKAN